MLSSFHASAALYRVVEVTPPGDLTSYYEDSDNFDYTSSFGTAIEPSVDSNGDSDGINCFSDDCYDGSYNYILSGETRYQGTIAGQPVDGTSFKEEVPFGLYNYKSDIYLDSKSDFSDYCSAELGYTTCSSWAKVFWNERNRELTGDTVTAFPFIQDEDVTSATTVESKLGFDLSSTDLYNSVVTGTDGSEGYGFTISMGDQRSTITPNPAPASYTKVRAFKTKTYDSTAYTVGSVSSVYSSSDNSLTSKAAIWAGSGSYTELPWKNSTDTIANSYLPQGSIRDFVFVDTDSDDIKDTIYAVGYNSYKNSKYYMTATLFTAPVNTYSSASWSQSLVDNATVTSGDSNYSNTRLTGINDNLVAIGESKLDSSHTSGGSRTNKLFVVADVSSDLSATYFSDGTGNIGFTGAGGHATAINNHNEIVGQIDTESSREVDGKPRRKRGFIYPYNDDDNGSIFNNKAWILDDLTNGGDYSSANNAFRILSANDINDAGVIAATAIKCPGGYSSTTHDASCSGTERTVAVQLIPIAGAESDDISARGYESTTIERQGASFGLFGLGGLFGLFMLRRKK